MVKKGSDFLSVTPATDNLNKVSLLSLKVVQCISQDSRPPQSLWEILLSTAFKGQGEEVCWKKLSIHRDYKS